MSTSHSSNISFLVAAAAVSALIGAGTAEASSTTVRAAANGAERVNAQQAAPPDKRVATHNPIYRTGSLPKINCRPGTVREGSAASYKAFMQRVNACLDKSWATQFKKARIPYEGPRLQFVTSHVDSPCGPWPAGAEGRYCSRNKTIYIGITQKRIDDPFEVYLAYFLGHEYTHHVQAMNGIFTKYYPAAWAEAGENGRLELSRRLELQADCFSSAFVGSVRGTLPVKASDWKYLIDWKRENGGKHWPKNDHGQGTTQAYWMEKGFKAGGPAGCNTWTAPGKQVT